MSKLAFVGSGGSTEHAVDVLKKSLALRNKSYKELMVQCNLMGRGEARSLQKLEKAEAKIKKLKTRLQELERTVEEKDNEVLRSLKKSKSANLSANKQSSDPPSVIKCSLDDQTMNVNEAPMALKKTRLLNNDPSCSKLNMDVPEIIKVFGSEACKETNNIIDVDLESDSWCFIKEDAPECYEEMAVRKYKKSDPDGSTSSYAKDSGSKAGTTADLHIDLDKIEESVSHTILTTLGAEELPYHDISEHPHQFSIKREHQNLGSNSCISGSEEATKYIGKWCKRAQIKTCSSPTMQGSSATGELISVGADGRGGRIKVLRSHNQLMDDKVHSSIWPKRLKNGAKQGGQTKGCLQIEHFFTKGGGQF
ncbi:hypothetical protein QJS04_geneDACA011549 [Acorus gramineus]|uniref:Uncharacterized protein n=1 Tax=Acorus gramineus TaxID=55184 RepID=A0AAV9AF54_ACOGR|nr:hypothetical protein QJS04_geneDACA011549 [Acorus gramineus]